MKDIMKIFKSLEDSSLSIKGDTKTIKNETKEKKGRVTDILLGTLGVSLLGNMLVGNERKESGVGFLMTLDPLTSFEIQRYY